ncbi:MAG TPA: hypothetical protein VN812_15425 [Candidatus Acidoferrales bacterium]|nr:hypothetical protein [Candidatus Acidoferrales bacterium]
MINRRFVVVVLASLALDAGVAAAAVTVAIGSAAGTPGQMVELGATLTADAQDPVAGVENDLNFAPAASVAVGADGRPDCSLNPAIRKSATAFSFRPLGCDPQAGQCTAIHALVVAVDNLDPIPSGAVLYSCRVAISGQAQPGRYALTVTNALYAPPNGGDHTANGNDGVVTALGSSMPPSAGNGGGGCQIGTGGSRASLWLALGLLACRRFRRSRDAR